MNKLITIGELLIDFIPTTNGSALKDVNMFQRVAGGAPANVAACVSKLGQKSVVLTKVGEDAFGTYLIDTLENAKVQTTYIKRTSEANTALAFVSLKEDGERDFTFYRNPSADLLYNSNDLPKDIFKPNDILHFCSVDLVESPMKQAHIEAIDLAHKNSMIVSFDPNLRFPLWLDKELYYNTIQEFLPKAHILKISEDELSFITRLTDIEKAIQSLFTGNVRVVIITSGSNGATIYTKNAKIYAKSMPVKATDTTGAGDSFIGAVLSQILSTKITLESLENIATIEVLQLAHKVSSIVVQKPGGIPSMPKLKEIE